MLDVHATATATSVPRRNRRIHLVMTAINTRYREPDLQLADLARQANLSVCYLSRVLKHDTGRGFLAHLHARRVDAARYLLTHSLLSVKEIAMAVGYQSATQLGRHYKRTLGFTPSEARTRFIHLAVDRDAVAHNLHAVGDDRKNR